MKALWAGEWIEEAELPARMAALNAKLEHSMPAPLDCEILLDACEKLSRDLSVRGPHFVALLACLERDSTATDVDIRTYLEELHLFLQRSSLKTKMTRELASGVAQQFPFRLERMSYREELFEAWVPLGFLVHIAPTNAANVPFLSMIEGLLCGNVCLLKTGSADSDYPLETLKALVNCDETGRLREFIYAARISSSQKELLKLVLSAADGVAVWGSEEAVTGIRALAPSQARIIDWGHKISLAYVEAAQLHSPDLDRELAALAQDCCLHEQQACSSPQVIYLDTSSESELLEFAARFAKVLNPVSMRMPAVKSPSRAEQAELTRVRQLAELETCFQGTDQKVVRQVLRGENWTLLVDANPGLKASPLYRVVWIKPLPKKDILATLRPLRHYLQTVGLAAHPSQLNRLTTLFFQAGALRITSPGQMLEGSTGEPHDGVYALQRYSRRVSLRQSNSRLRGISGLDEIGEEIGGEIGAEVGDVQGCLKTHSKSQPPILTKEQLADQKIATKDAELFFKSGGSSGEPRLSVFTYDDYHLQMKLAAQGLFAAGLDPATDRCMNLFFGGGLYGGFLSFFTILEELRAVQLPMSAHAELEYVARTIVQQKVSVLLGMPSYLIPLFQQNEALFSKARVVRKLFYAGEHFSEAQKSYLSQQFGVTLIRSAAYGGNDTGPMGFQCEFCEGAVHHLHERLHFLEIVGLAADVPCAPGEAGRMILTSRVRQGQKLVRYDLGDLGRWLPQEQPPCPCGRSGKRFELLGRHGDIFKSGGSLLNYQKIAQALATKLGFSGEFQLKLGHHPQETLTLLYSDGGPEGSEFSPILIRQACLEAYPDLATVVEHERAVTFLCEAVTAPELVRTAGSGKLRHVLDLQPNQARS